MSATLWSVYYDQPRLDLKCGKGSISPGERCTKGRATEGGRNPISIRSHALTGAKWGAGIGAGIGGLNGVALGASMPTSGGVGGRIANAAIGGLAGAAGGALSGAVQGGVIGAGVGAVRKGSYALKNRKRKGKERDTKDSAVWAVGFTPE